jgi:transposase
MTVTTQRAECTQPVGGRLLMSMELGRRQWTLAFTTGIGQRPRRRTLSTTAWERVRDEIAAAKARFGLPVDAPVVSCYEAGRDGFWIHRYLTSLGVENVVVDSSSIEVNRRARRAKTDRMDVEKLLAMLLRYVGGERRVWRVVRVPTEADEHRRQLHRELLAAKQDRTRLTNRIAGLLATVGVQISVSGRFRDQLDRLMQWNGQPLPEALRVRLVREWKKAELLTLQIRELERERRALLRESEDEAVVMVRRLRQLRGIGDNAAWLYVMELFAWRQFRNRREVGGSLGLVGTPYKSGALDHEQGISRAGNKRVRTMAVQIAWGWLTYQRASALTHWYNCRFAHGGPRARKIGIVAVARRLVIDLWRYLDAGVIPDGAILKVEDAALSEG